jgi:hypothetical protein
MEIMTTTLDLDREYAHLLAVMQPKVIESEAENEVCLAEVSKAQAKVLGDFFRVSPTLFL